VSLTWTGNLGSGTSGYRDYSRDYEIGAEPVITAPPTQPFGETGPTGTRKSCSWHRCRLWYLHLAAEAGIIVTAYAEAVLEIARDGAGRFKSVVLRPTAVTVAAGSDVGQARR
jgi:hypothetical protein